MRSPWAAIFVSAAFQNETKADFLITDFPVSPSRARGFANNVLFLLLRKHSSCYTCPVPPLVLFYLFSCAPTRVERTRISQPHWFTPPGTGDLLDCQGDRLYRCDGHRYPLWVTRSMALAQGTRRWGPACARTLVQQEGGRASEHACAHTMVCVHARARALVQPGGRETAQGGRVCSRGRRRVGGGGT